MSLRAIASPPRHRFYGSDEMHSAHEDIAKLEHLGPMVDSVIKISDDLDAVEKLQRQMKARESQYRERKCMRTQWLWAHCPLLTAVHAAKRSQRPIAASSGWRWYRLCSCSWLAPCSCASSRIGSRSTSRCACERSSGSKEDAGVASSPVNISYSWSFSLRFLERVSSEGDPCSIFLPIVCTASFYMSRPRVILAGPLPSLAGLPRAQS
jgi:hypothetical protein